MRITSRRSPTQYDVAKAAGVSQTTVSLVLNNPGTSAVPPETQQKIFDAVKSLGYVLNSTARMLRTSRTYTLACIIPMITNPFYPAFVSGIQACAEQYGYDVITYNTHNSADREAKFLTSVQQGRVDGVIGVFFFTRAPDLAPLFEKEIPVVRLEVRRPNVGSWPLDNIFVDNTSASYTATSYLIQRGHRSIGFLTGPAGPRDARREGYLKALANAMIPEPLIQEAEDFTEQGGYQAMHSLLRELQPPTAIFGANDLMAIGAMQAIHEAGLRIPEDVAVVGFDDIPAAAMVHPGLTTIRQYQEKMGRRAAKMLIERLEGKYEGDGREEEMPFELVKRGSV